MASLVTFSDDDDDDDDYKIIPEEIWVLKEGKKNEFYDKVEVTEIKYDRVLGVYYVHYKSISDLNEVEDSFLSKKKFLDLYELDLDDFELEATSSNDGDLPDISELLDMNNISKYTYDDGDDSSSNNNDNAFKVSNEKKNDTDKLKPNKKRAANKVPTTSQRKQKRRTNPREKIHWEFLSRDYNTLFYPKYKGKVVPQVMTIAEVREKPKKVYIFAIKDPNTNIDKRIETWTAWRKDHDAVNNWIKQIKRIKTRYKTDPTKSNFLKALQRSFTIVKKGLFVRTKFDPLKVEMAVCYVHFIKNKGTDHTWNTFKEYFDNNANCDALKKIFDSLKKEKKQKNLETANNFDEVFQAHTRLDKFASEIFHKDIEYVKDKTFDVLGVEEEKEAKKDFAEMFKIKMSTTGAKGGFTSMLMTKLKF